MNNNNTNFLRLILLVRDGRAGNKDGEAKRPTGVICNARMQDQPVRPLQREASISPSAVSGADWLVRPRREMRDEILPQRRNNT